MISIENVRPLKDFPSNVGLKLGYSRKEHGNMSYRLGEDEEVLHNRQNFFAEEAIPTASCVTFFTEHKDDLDVLTEFPENRDAIKGQNWKITDAILTQVPATTVFLTFADCVPFVLFDQRQKCMAFAHIGWRSMSVGFTAKVIQEFKETFNAKNEDLLVAIGPCIRQESYLFADPIQAEMMAWMPYLERHHDGRWGIDLVGFCLKECEDAGLSQDQVYVSGMDTAKEPDQFSHYAATVGEQSEKEGRFIFYASLR